MNTSNLVPPVVAYGNDDFFAHLRAHRLATHARLIDQAASCAKVRAFYLDRAAQCLQADRAYYLRKAGAVLRRQRRIEREAAEVLTR